MKKPVLAFLQNRYLRASLVDHRMFKDPAALDNRTEIGKRVWERMLYTSLTGQRLHKHLGPELYERIEWDNASPEIGQVSSSAFPADYDYMRRCVQEEGNPPILIGLGAPAAAAVRHIVETGLGYQPKVLAATHPACRIYPRESLDRLATDLRAALAKLR